MVQVVPHIVRPRRRAVAIVSRQGEDVGMELVHEEVHRMTRDDESYEEAGEVEEMLDRVHREARPRPRGVTFVVQTVHVAVEKCTDITLRQAIPPVPPGVHHSMAKEEMDRSELGC